MVREKAFTTGLPYLLSAFIALVVLAAPIGGAAADSPIAEGKALFEGICDKCHDLDRSLGKKADRAGWEKTINRMIAGGAQVDESQKQLLLGYLTAKSTFETRCNTCHDLDRPLKSIKNPEEWQATVARMSEMKPGHISGEEAGAIALYLSLVTPVE